MNSTRIEREAKLNSSPCIWMQAAVVRRKACEIDYQCQSCRFDQALGRVARENRKLREQGITILIIEQNVRYSLETADCASVIENGRITLSDTCSVLLDSDHVRKAYLGL